MVLTDEGPGFAIYYQDIRPALIRTIPPGAPRFQGRIVNGNYVIGNAFVYTKFCFGKSFPYHVSGVIHDGIIDLHGPAAVVDPHSCTIVGLRADSDNAHVVFAELAPPPPPPAPEAEAEAAKQAKARQEALAAQAVAEQKAKEEERKARLEAEAEAAKQAKARQEALAAQAIAEQKAKEEERKARLEAEAEAAKQAKARQEALAAQAAAEQKAKEEERNARLEAEAEAARQWRLNVDEARVKGDEYAKRGISKWSISEADNPMTDDKDYTVASEQANEKGAIAFVEGTCQKPGRVTFVATLQDALDPKSALGLPDFQTGYIAGNKRINDNHQFPNKNLGTIF
jgi:flagellar biosynthesis GTPase FlhF